MGTSKGYDAPPSWADLKAEVTKAAAGPLGSSSAKQLLGNLIRHNGGVGGMARSASAASGRHVAGGAAARGVAVRLGGFLADVASVGLDDALRRAGWADLVGKPVREVLAALLDRLGGQASTIDDVDARMALSRLNDKYFGDAVSVSDLEEKLSTQVERLELVLEDFFAFYLFEVFCRVFFERLVERVGETRAQAFLHEIEELIAATLRNRTVTHDIRQINWAGEEGRRVTADIMETVLTVFGG